MNNEVIVYVFSSYIVSPFDNYKLCKESTTYTSLSDAYEDYYKARERYPRGGGSIHKVVYLNGYGKQNIISKKKIMGWKNHFKKEELASLR